MFPKKSSLAMPKVANGIDLVWKPWQVHAENWQYELCRGLIPKKAGRSGFWRIRITPTWGFTAMPSHSSSRAGAHLEITNHP
jgi:hypothetical protein